MLDYTFTGSSAGAGTRASSREVLQFQRLPQRLAYWLLNRSQFSGYKVVFVPFRDGKPAGKPEDFLTGFLVGNEKDVYGRPVGVTVLKDGSMLVADDASNTLWRVSANP